MIAGLILAAGAGTRFGDSPKLLAELDGRPLLQHALDACEAVPELERVVVVLGARADLVVAGIRPGRAEVIRCPDWAEGMSASLRAGAMAVRGAERVIVTLGDSPTVTPALLRRFLDAPDGARAVYGGVPGHPAVLGTAQLALVPTLEGDVGARELLRDGHRIECGDLASGNDVDTPDDLARLSGTAGGAG